MHRERRVHYFSRSERTILDHVLRTSRKTTNCGHCASDEAERPTFNGGCCGGSAECRLYNVPLTCEMRLSCCGVTLKTICSFHDSIPLLHRLASSIVRYHTLTVFLIALPRRCTTCKVYVICLSEMRFCVLVFFTFLTEVPCQTSYPSCLSLQTT